MVPPMLLALFCLSADAMTLEEAVSRAASLDPAAVIAEHDARIAALAAQESWAGLGLTPALGWQQRLSAGARAGTLSWSVSVGALDPSAWFDALQQGAQRDSAEAAAAALRLDAQYAAALLYYDALSAAASVEAARAALASAEGIAEVTRARLAAGLESELAARAAELERLRASAALAQAESDLRVARARLQRALQADPGELSAPPLPEFPESGNSPWLDRAAEEIRAAGYGRQERVAELFPAGFLEASSSTTSGAGTSATTSALTVGLTWSLDGVVGPFLRARSATLERRIAEVSYDNLKLDLDLGLTEARAQADAARAQVEAARAREALAAESLAIGQARARAGLSSTLELLRLQDEVLSARTDRIRAEQAQAVAILAARRLAGLGW